MKQWSLDARSRRRKPQALCGGGERRIRGDLEQGDRLTSLRLTVRISPILV